MLLATSFTYFYVWKYTPVNVYDQSTSKFINEWKEEWVSTNAFYLPSPHSPHHWCIQQVLLLKLGNIRTIHSNTNTNWKSAVLALYLNIEEFTSIDRIFEYGVYLYITRKICVAINQMYFDMNPLTPYKWFEVM